MKSDTEIYIVEWNLLCTLIGKTYISGSQCRLCH